MMDLLTFIKELGAESLDILWLPLGIWTVLAATATVIFRIFKKIPAVYQYHGRVAIMWALPVGIVVSALLHLVSLFTSEATATATKFIVISNPITVRATVANPTFNWTEPAFWLGILTAIGAATAVFGVFRLAANISTLRSLTRNFKGNSKATHDLLSQKNKKLLAEECPRTTLLFSDDIAVPCTFGWRHKWVLLPVSMQANTEKLNIAVRHELMHICQSDYLLNATLQGIKALFYFHPLIHLLEKETEEYRELYCDQHVLVDPDISEKRYAELLFELSSKNLFRSTAAVSMAVHPSTLKKRIQVMKNRSNSIPPIKRSITLMLITGLLFTGIMACSDMEEGGITNTEVEQAQANAGQLAQKDQPLYVVNGEKVTETVKISRIKPKYIESIDVLKGEKATAEYGEEGTNGVIKITLIDKEKAYSDLLDEAPALPKTGTQNSKGEFYVAVEQAPQIKGGLKSIMSRVQYPKACKEAGIEGRVVVRFIVNTQGKAEDVEVLRGIGGACNEEAKRVVRTTEFEPGKQRGKAVRVQMSLPIVFKLPSSDSVAR